MTTKKKRDKNRDTDARLFRDGLRASLLVCSKDELRIALNAIRFEVDCNIVRLISTDGHRLLVVSMTLDSEKLGATREFLVGRKNAIRCLKLLALESDGQSDVELKDTASGLVLFGLPDAKLKIRKVEKDYPKYSEIIPELADNVPESHATGLSGPYLKDLANIADIILGPCRGSGIRIQPNGGALSPVRFDIKTGARRISATYMLMPMRIP